jgi:RING finger protein 113A
VCKDYKETGRCGFGDSCKFLHDRGDYKQSHQLDADWNAEQEKKRKMRTGEGQAAAAAVEADEAALPWACLICRQPFDTPVVTRCQHYYCEKCALKHYVADTKCFACKAQTSGIFNVAFKLIAAIKLRAANGVDPRLEIERAEKERQKEKEERATGEKWIMPGRTAGL